MTSHLTAVLVAVAAVGAASTGCARTAAQSTHGTDTLYVGVAAARGSLAYFRGVQLALDRLMATDPAGLRHWRCDCPPTLSRAKWASPRAFATMRRSSASLGTPAARKRWTPRPSTAMSSTADGMASSRLLPPRPIPRSRASPSG